MDGNNTGNPGAPPPGNGLSYDNKAYEEDQAPVPQPVTPAPVSENGELPTKNGSAMNGTTGPMEGKMSPEEDEYEREQQAKRDREPLLICKWIVARPKTWFGKSLYINSTKCVIIVINNVPITLPYIAQAQDNHQNTSVLI